MSTTRRQFFGTTLAGGAAMVVAAKANAELPAWPQSKERHPIPPGELTYWEIGNCTPAEIAEILQSRSAR